MFFFDGLIHDDPYWFYQATEDGSFMPFRGSVSALTPYIDNFYAKGMLYLGTEFLHFIYIGIMALASLCAYFFYRNVFFIKDVIAVPASVIPNILPSLMIPLGFNASYAIWPIPTFFLSLICLYKSSQSHSLKFYTLYWSAFLLYCVTLNISVAGTFLIPCTIIMFILFLEKERLHKVIVKSLPFLLIGIYHLHKHSQHSHKEPVLNSIYVIVYRWRQFIEMVNFLFVDNAIGVWVILALFSAGLIAIYNKKDNFDVFEVEANKFNRQFIVFWILCFLGANSLAYLAISPTFRPYDYAYVFNYGAVFLILTGAISCLCYLSRYLPFNVVNGKHGLLFIIISVLFVGSQRIYAYYDSSLISGMENTSKDLRRLLSGQKIPKDSQLIILDVALVHQGVEKVNSGYIRYLSGRNDIRAIIGSDRYPLDPFTVSRSWFNPMQNIAIDRPVISFRRTADGFERVNYLLQTTINEGKLPRFLWHLFDVSDSQYPPFLIKKGEGIDSYIGYLDTEFEGDKPFVAFSPVLPTDDILSAEQARGVIKEGVALEGRVNYSDVVTLINVQNTLSNKEVYLQVLIRINNLPKDNFKLGYKVSGINGGIKGVYTLDSSDYLAKGDYVLFYHPLSNLKADASVQDVEFYNTGVWPYKRIESIDDHDVN